MGDILLRTDRVLQYIIEPMRHLSYIPILLILLTSPSAVMTAQDYTPVPVTISKEKVKVDGKVYYSHIVLERQTLYSICKAYNVTIDQIYEANPAVKAEGLKKNAIILIPAADRKLPRETVKETVEKSVEKPASEKREWKEGVDYVVHTVKWYEDLDVIADRYNVTVDAIMQANGLTGRKLTRRQKLKIPLNPEMTQSEAVVTDTVATAGTPETDAASLQPVAVKGRDRINAVLMLPFNASGERPRSGSVDFYCGVLMAARQAGENGVNIDLSVYDVEDGLLPVSKEQLSKSDVVIGPISATAIARLLAECPASTNVVSPLDHKAEYLAASHSNFIQAPSSSLVLYEDLARWIKEERSGSSEKVIVIYEKGSRDIDGLGTMNSILEKDGIAFSTFSYSILEGRDVQSPLMAMMTREAANRVLVMSESEAFVNDVVRNLNLLIHEDYEIVLYAPSKIRSFETIEVNNLHNTRLHTSLSYYVDYEEDDVKDFVRKYRALYSAEPTPYAFQGYDVATYFFRMYSEHGKGWAEALVADSASMLQTEFKFRKESPEGGYVNTGVRRIIYGPDYSVEIVGD